MSDTLGMFGGMGMYSNPWAAMLSGMSRGFAEAAMPRPYRVPLGAAIGMAAGGMQEGMANAQRMAYQNAQLEHMKAGTDLERQKIDLQKAAAARQAQAFGLLANNPVDMWGASGGAPAQSGAASPSRASMPLAAQQDLAVRTILAEAGGEGPDGMAAVANVIRNRVGSGQWGNDVSSVVLAPKQFSAWNEGSGNDPRRFDPNSPQYQTALQIWNRVNSGAAQDSTGGALHYANVRDATAPWVKDAMAGPADSRTQIGNHTFFRGLNVGAPQQYAQAGNVATDAAPVAVAGPQPGSMMAAPGSYDPRQIAAQFMRRAEIAAMAGLPGLPEQYREQAKMVMQGHRPGSMTINGRTIQGQWSANGEFKPFGAELQADLYRDVTMPGGVVGQRGMNGKVDYAPVYAQPSAVQTREQQARQGYEPDGQGGYQFVRGGSADPATQGAIEGAKTQATESTKARIDLDTTTQRKFAEGLGDDLRKGVEQIKVEASKAPDLIETAQRIRQYVKNGAIVGTGAPALTAFATLMNKAGVNNSETLANSRLLVADMANTTLASIRTSGLGGGNGFTEQDRKFLEKAKAGTQDWDGESIMRLASLNERAARLRIVQYNETMDKVSGMGAAGQLNSVLSPKMPLIDAQTEILSMQGLKKEDLQAGAVYQTKTGPAVWTSRGFVVVE